MAKNLMAYVPSQGDYRSLSNVSDNTMNGMSTFGQESATFGTSSQKKTYVMNIKTYGDPGSSGDYTFKSESYGGSTFSNANAAGISSASGMDFTFGNGFNVQEAYGSIQIGASASSSSESTIASNFKGAAIQNVIGFSLLWKPTITNVKGFARPSMVGLVYAQYANGKWNRFTCSLGEGRNQVTHYGDKFADTTDPGQKWSTYYLRHGTSAHETITNRPDVYWIGMWIEMKNKPSGVSLTEYTRCNVSHFKPIISLNADADPHIGTAKRMLFNCTDGATLSEIVDGKYCFA